ncbi:MAG TPA: DUF6284 family protein [Mycobacteriales bacterium]|nr:DUF6284 family protein [Mycobacteriales bacterium]
MGSIARLKGVHLVPVEVDREPSAGELAAVEAEVPLLLAEFAVIQAEAVLSVSPGCQWAQRVHRRAVRQCLAAAAHLAADTGPWPLEVA